MCSELTSVARLAFGVAAQVLLPLGSLPSVSRRSTCNAWSASIVPPEHQLPQKDLLRWPWLNRIHTCVHKQLHFEINTTKGEVAMILMRSSIIHDFCAFASIKCACL